MPKKIAIIGAGWMAAYHVAGFRSAGAEVVAIVDKVPAAAKTASQKYGVDKTFSEPKELYAAIKDVDAVSIITPNVFHHPLVMEALAAGKHVFCEKPPALNAADVGQMVDAAKKAGKTLMFNFNNRARPESYAMREYFKSGAVGRVNSAQAAWIRRNGIPGFGGWFTTKKLSGGGPLIDLLHMVDLALHFMGYPEPAFVLGQTFSDNIDNKEFKGPWGIPDVQGGITDVEAAAHALVTFKTGQVLTLRNSWAELNEREVVSVVFQGQKAGGKIQRLFRVDGIDATSVDTCEIYSQENGFPVNRTIIVEPDETMGRTRSAKNFALVLDDREAPLNEPGEAYKLMKIIDGVYASAKTGRPVELS
ncbi:MAG TPA: Gfo/Idh/MocA family oxidoreductase [Planctomycetota bacterium]|jgi:predicted dehydrogenase|nr:Gfo/Idh/MocA family oxidoreductase [Planctomycetota bacterium]